jgi:small-conductance mechanosensitive channel/CRP-like cAMP-binding protein
MSEGLHEFTIVILEGTLALAAALAAVAFRRRTRIFSPAPFIMLALGLALELIIPRAENSPPWIPYARAAAIALMWCAVIRLAVEGIEGWIRRRQVHISTIATELTVTLLYAATFLLVSWKFLNFDARQLLALPVLFTLVSGWLQHRDLFAGLLIQSQKPFRPGDWVRLGDQVGQVQETGWRATRIRTRSRETITIPSDVLAKEVMTNYSSHGRVADEVTIGFGYDESPGTIETVILEMLAGVPEILKEPAAEIGPWEFGDWSIKYRIRYWLADYAEQEAVRGKVNRSLWYVMHRHAIGAPAPATLMPESRNDHSDGSPSQQQLISELRRVDLFAELSDDELRIVVQSIRRIEFGRGEALIRQGETGDCFFILRRGEVEVLREPANGDAPMVVTTIANSSPKNFFGEIALLKGEPRIVTIRAKTDVEVLRIDRTGFAHLFQARPEIAAGIAKIAAAREESTLAQAAGATTNLLQLVAEQQGKLLQTMRLIFDF